MWTSSTLRTFPRRITTSGIRVPPDRNILQQMLYACMRIADSHGISIYTVRLVAIAGTVLKQIDPLGSSHKRNQSSSRLLLYGFMVSPTARQNALLIFRYSVTASTVRFHRADPGSTPGIGAFFCSEKNSHSCFYHVT